MCNKNFYIFASFVCILLLMRASGIVAKTTTVVRHTDTTDPQSDGFWAHKTTWKSRWVKYWRPKAIYVPVWKKVWTPTILKEYVPLPNAPTGWDSAWHGKKFTLK